MPAAMEAPPLSTAAKSREGFTLIELLVVIAIIAILVAILLPVFSTIENYSRRAQVASDRRNISVSIISYYNDYRKYPLNEVQVNAVQYGSNDTVYGDPGGLYSSADLFDILRAQADN
jgi:prepilin-type N-terminal cleavage/methylation domain-containing protein